MNSARTPSCCTSMKANAGRRALARRCSRLDAYTLLHRGKRFAVAPQTAAVDERVLQAGSRHALQLAVRQVLVLDSPQVFVCHVGARNAFVIRGQGDRYTCPHEIVQGMFAAPT